MSLAQEIINLIKEEGYKVNEAVTDALTDFIEVVEDETDGVDDEVMDEDNFDDED